MQVIVFSRGHEGTSSQLRRLPGHWRLHCGLHCFTELNTQLTVFYKRTWEDADSPQAFLGEQSKLHPERLLTLSLLSFHCPTQKRRKKKEEEESGMKTLQFAKDENCIMCYKKGIVPHTFNSLQISTLCQHLKFGERFEFYTNIYVNSFLLTVAKVIQCIHKYINKNCEHLNI